MTRKPGEADPVVTAPADFPTDWREKMATGSDGKVDDKVLARLKRFDSPTAVTQSFLELDRRMASGKSDAPMPDATKDAEGNKKWREDRGLPVAAEDYKIPDAVMSRLTDADKPVLASFTGRAFKEGWPQSYVDQATAWYADLQEESQAAQAKVDDQMAKDTEDALRKAWGPEYRANDEVAKRFAQETVPGVDLFTARTQDGRLVGNIPELIHAMAALGLQKYGDVSFAGGEAAKATQSRMDELKTIMTTDFDRWQASPALRDEYQALLDKQAKRQPAAA